MNTGIVMGIIITVGLVFSVFCAIIFVKMKIDEIKGIQSDEKARIAEILNSVIPSGTPYTPLYAYRYDNKEHPKSYRHYAIGFSQEQLYAVALSFDGKDIAHGKPLLIEKQNLGKIGAVYNEAPIHYVSFYDKNETELLSIWVEQSNTRWNKAAHFNIQQKTEAKAFMQTLYQWMEDVNHHIPKKIMGI